MSDNELTLVIGNKNYSTWSLRPWLWMRQRGLVFDEVRVPLFTEEMESMLEPYSSGNKVPVLLHGPRIVWDSLAILEYLNETFPHMNGWPEQADDRAMARSMTAEMHSSFMALRNAMPMNCRRPVRAIDYDEAVQADIDRITELWSRCREQHHQQGPWLFGHHFCIADAFFAPVVMRFHTYDVAVEPVISEYMDSVIRQPAMQDWIADGIVETEIIEEDEI